MKKVNPYVYLGLSIASFFIAFVLLSMVCGSGTMPNYGWRVVNGQVAAPEYGEGNVYRCLMPCEIYVKETSASGVSSKLSVPRGNYIVGDPITFYKNNLGQVSLFGNGYTENYDLVFYVFAAFFALVGILLSSMFIKEMLPPRPASTSPLFTVLREKTS